jgi:hypothetical protein
MRSVRTLSNVSLLFMLAVGFPAIGQMGRIPGTGYPGGRTGTSLPPAVPGGGKPSKTQKTKPEDNPLPTFKGILRGADSKLLSLEVPGDNTLQFNCSKKTAYYDGSRKIKVSALKPGDHLAVEARRALDGTLDAVSVRLDR